jgi:hypothetical protein
MSIEMTLDIPFIAALSLREKQIQQNYRPIIAVHKWFARRPGTLFRGLILSEYSNRLAIVVSLLQQLRRFREQLGPGSQSCKVVLNNRPATRKRLDHPSNETLISPSQCETPPPGDEY